MSSFNSISIQLNNFRKKGHFCDVELLVGENKYPCHRVMLAAASVFFNKIFNCDLREKNAYTIPLKTVNEKLFSIILDFIYGGELNITPQNAYKLLKLSDYLEMECLLEECIKFITNTPNVDNILEICKFAKDPLQNLEFEKTVINIAKSKYIQLQTTHAFLTTSFNLLEVILEKCSTACNFITTTDCSECGHSLITYHNDYLKYSTLLYCRYCHRKCSKCVFCHHASNQHSNYADPSRYCQVCGKNCGKCACGHGPIAHNVSENLSFSCNSCSSSSSSNQITLAPLIKWIQFDIIDRMKYFPRLAEFAKLGQAYTNELTALILEHTTALHRTLGNSSITSKIVVLSQTKDDDFLTIILDQKNWCMQNFYNFTANDVKIIQVDGNYYFFTLQTTEEKMTQTRLWIHEANDLVELMSPPSNGNFQITCINNEIFLYFNVGVSSNNYDASSRGDIEALIKSNHIFSYIIHRDKWLSIPEIPKPIYNSYFVSLNQEIFLIGGTLTANSKDTSQKILQRYDPHLAKWVHEEIEVDLNLQGCACSYNNTIYIYEPQTLTSTDDQCEFLAVLHIFEVISNKWSTIINSKIKCHPRILLPFEDIIYIFPDIGEHPVEIFNPKTNDFTTFKTLPKSMLIEEKDVEISRVLSAFVST